MLFTLTVIAVLSALVLSHVYNLTKEPIAKAKDNRELEAISEVVSEFDNDPFAEKMITIRVFLSGRDLIIAESPLRSAGPPYPLSSE